MTPASFNTKDGTIDKKDSQLSMRGFICLQTDDKAYDENRKLILKEQEIAQRFDCKPITGLCKNSSFNFSGASITLKEKKYCISQDDHI